MGKALSKEDIIEKWSKELGERFAGLDSYKKPLIWIVCSNPKCNKKYKRQYHQIANYGRPEFCKVCSVNEFKRRGREFANAK